MNKSSIWQLVFMMKRVSLLNINLCTRVRFSSQRPAATFASVETPCDAALGENMAVISRVQPTTRYEAERGHPPPEKPNILLKMMMKN